MRLRMWSMGISMVLLGCGGVVVPGAGGDGGTAGGPSVSPPGSTVPTFDTCPGCRLDGACVDATPDHCGEGGGDCETCTADACEVAACIEGLCGVLVADDGDPCAGGTCSAGVCVP